MFFRSWSSFVDICMFSCLVWRGSILPWSHCQPAQIADHSHSSSRICRVNNPSQRHPASYRTGFNDPPNQMVQNVAEGDIRNQSLKKTIHLIVGAIQIRPNRLYGWYKALFDVRWTRQSPQKSLNQEPVADTPPRKKDTHHRLVVPSRTSVCYTAGGAQNVSGPRQTRQELIQI